MAGALEGDIFIGKKAEVCLIKKFEAHTLKNGKIQVSVKCC